MDNKSQFLPERLKRKFKAMYEQHKEAEANAGEVCSGCFCKSKTSIQWNFGNGITGMACKDCRYNLTHV